MIERPEHVACEDMDLTDQPVRLMSLQCVLYVPTSEIALDMSKAGTF